MHLIAIWLIASRSREYHPDGDPLVPHDETYITKKSGLKKKITLKPLIDSGFLVCYQHAINMLSESKHLAPTDLDLETYKEETENPSSSSDDPPPNGFSPNDMMRLWNDGVDFYAKDREVLIPKIQKLTDKRKKKALARIKDCQIDETRWRSVINTIHQSEFLSGKKPGKGHENWSADFNFTVESETTLTKILEGGYR